MNSKTWTRQSFLAASGISLALPYFESMANGSKDKAPPKRFCAMYFPYGIVRLPAKHKYAKWNWFPTKTGGDYELTKPLEVLKPYKSDISIISGLSHKGAHRLGGHESNDNFLTGADLTPYNTVSLDQDLAINKGLGLETRYSSMVLVNDGMGSWRKSNTLSFNNAGKEIPPINRPSIVFEKFFGLKKGSFEARHKSITSIGSHLDLLLKESKNLRGKLNAEDKRKFDLYLESVRGAEINVERAVKWLDVPMPKFDGSNIKLNADNSSPDDLTHAMLDLIALAFQTDLTRFATYQLAGQNNVLSEADNYPFLLGWNTTSHKLAHDINKDDGAEQKGKWDRHRSGYLKYLLDKLAAIPEGNGSVLDNTCIFYGSSNSNTHNNRYYPIVLAGGKNMGFKHGRHVAFRRNMPLANLFVTIQKRMGANCDKFADSTGWTQRV